MSPPFAHTPDRLREEPPQDQFCDLVLNGGVASGVVYPWALLKLARHYRFRSIGGNSVGAMAAAMAAAAEYGRCHGVENAFEPLRQMPLKLAEPWPEGDRSAHPRDATKMLHLFRPTAGLQRLFDLFLLAARSGTASSNATRRVRRWRKRVLGLTDFTREWKRRLARAAICVLRPMRYVASPGKSLLFHTSRLFGFWSQLALWLGVLIGVWWLVVHHFGGAGPLSGTGSSNFGLFLALGTAVLVASVAVARRVLRDLRALVKNDFGLCTGRGQPGRHEEGLAEWLHRGIQLSAGRGEFDPPLTFADLWTAPRLGQAGPGPLPDGTMPPEPGINLQMFASNVTLGRPVRLPLEVQGTRLFYDPEDWSRYFPHYLINALEKVSVPYSPRSASDPDLATMSEHQRKLAERLRELPGAEMPIVVAARMSLCFPILFSCIKVYAIDYERHWRRRQLRPCWLSDGGLCANFPVHLFDTAHPRWPTFALLLDSRLSAYKDQSVWLPPTHLQGRGDNWQRFVPGAEEKPADAQRPSVTQLLRLLGGMVLTMKDWNDRVTGRLPQVRNRMVRMALLPGEGQLNLGMSGATILSMAHKYGTLAGNELVRAFAPGQPGAQQAWKEHLYVRAMVELRALCRHLRGYSRALYARGSSEPLRAILDAATQARPLRVAENRPADTEGQALEADQRAALEQAVQAVQALEQVLIASEDRLGPYRPTPEPELRLRPPV